MAAEERDDGSPFAAAAAETICQKFAAGCLPIGIRKPALGSLRKRTADADEVLHARSACGSCRCSVEPGGASSRSMRHQVRIPTTGHHDWDPLSNEGPVLEDMLHRYLVYLVQRFRSEPTVSDVTSDEVERALSLDKEQSFKLFALLEWYGCKWAFGGSRSANGWRASVGGFIDEIADEPDMPTFVREELTRHYDPRLPVFANQRLSHQPHRPSPANDELSFIDDLALRTQLAADMNEARSVFKVKAWKSCVVLCGGIVEGALLSALRARTSEILERRSSLSLKKEGTDPERWMLSTMVRVSKELGITFCDVPPERGWPRSQPDSSRPTGG